jgi:hypothetical protein
MKEKPNVSHFQEFRAPIWIFCEDVKSLSKFDKQAITKHIFCGYLDRPKAVQYYNTETHRIKISCNYKFSNLVEFNELDIKVPSEGEKNRNASGTSGIQPMLPQTPSQHIPAKPAPKFEPSAPPPSR